MDLHGIYVYLVSPVDPITGKCRTKVLGRLVEHLVEAGVHGLSPLGSTGEFPYLDPHQKEEVVRTTVAAASGRVPVVPGVAAYTTADAIRQSQAYLEAGADGIVLMLQTFFPLPRAAIVEYFLDVAGSADRPFVLYSNPELLGTGLSPDIVIELAHAAGNIRYFKDASGNTGRLLTILRGAEDRIRFFSASAHVPLLVFQLGGVGWMSGPACLLPRECVALYELWRRGHYEEAFTLQKRLWGLNIVFQKYSLAACVKAGLEMQGFDVGAPIRPQSALDAAACAEIRSAVEEARSV